MAAVRGIYSRLLHEIRTRTGSPRFRSGDVRVGQNVSFGRNVVFNCDRVRIGDGVAFRDNVRVDATDFEIGDYGTIYENCFFPGPGRLKIGHNFWLGTAAIVDCQGGTAIGNNVGIGAHSQLWTHMVFGDVMAGCRFHSASPLEVEDDVWLVGHCLVSPVKLGARSLAMLGSLITKEMLPDRVYAGSPARDITDRVGPQFRETTVQERARYLQGRIEAFASTSRHTSVWDSVQIVTREEELPDSGRSVTVFNVASRSYRKIGSQLEHDLLRFLLPEAKFLPR